MFGRGCGAAVEREQRRRSQVSAAYMTPLLAALEDRGEFNEESRACDDRCRDDRCLRYVIAPRPFQSQCYSEDHLAEFNGRNRKTDVCASLRHAASLPHA